MHNSVPILLIFLLATGYGFWYQKSRGRMKMPKSSRTKAIGAQTLLDSTLLGSELGSRATFLQFSSAFCTPCRATRALLTDITADLPDVKHIEVDAEKNLNLVRQLDIRSTPTTLVLDKNGAEIGRAVGAPKRSEIIKTLENIS